MRREVWLGALALLGAVNMDLGAQPLVWKRVERPVEAQVQATVRASSISTTSASLDRPIAQEDEQSLPPRTFPDAYRGGNPIGRSTPYQVERIPVIAAPGTIIAVGGSAPAMMPTPLAMGSADQDDPYRTGDQFASDRRFVQAGGDLPMPSRVTAATEPTPSRNWTQTYPVTPPPPAEWGDPAVGAPGMLRSRFYVGGEYLLWWTKNDKTPPLVTTGTITNLPPPRADGALGNPDTVVLFGGNLNRNPFSGGRFTVGLALDECGDKYLELTGFFLAPQSANFFASSSQYPLLTRPFFAANSNAQLGLPEEFREVVTAPGVAVGSISVQAPSQLWGLEPNLFCNWCQGCNYRIDALVGARYLNLRESITIVEDQLSDPTSSFLPNTRFQNTDRFATSNQFYGGQTGIRGYYQYDRFSIQGTAKVALGMTHEQTSINGFFTLPPGVVNPDPRPGGLLAEQSNIGTFNRDRFAVVPEVGVKLGYDLTNCIRLTVGYNVLYWSSVMRPGDQIDRNIDVLQVPNFVPPSLASSFTPVSPARPMPLLKDTDFWAQGLTVGVQFSY